MTTKTVERHDWLLRCADRLEQEGQSDLAGEARAEAAALLTPPAPAPTVSHLPCEDCGRPASFRRMPEDWPFDWWSHSRNGRPCHEALAR